MAMKSFQEAIDGFPMHWVRGTHHSTSGSEEKKSCKSQFGKIWNTNGTIRADKLSALRSQASRKASLMIPFMENVKMNLKFLSDRWAGQFIPTEFTILNSSQL
jgi:hypothetical protein